MSSRGVTIIACPTCGRLEVDLFKIAGDMEKKLAHIKKPMSLALMGCAVNGPGEATHADMGVAFGKDGGTLYKDGKKLGRLKAKLMLKTKLISKINLIMVITLSLFLLFLLVLLF